MLDAYALDALDRTVRDIEFDYIKKEKVMGGKVLVMGGDFRQCLLVLTQCSMGTVLSRLVTRSSTWTAGGVMQPVRICQLWHNMRVMSCTDAPEEEQQAWADYLLRVGNGREPLVPNEYSDLPCIAIAEDMRVESLDELILFVFQPDKPWAGCAIVCPRVETVNRINDLMLDRIDGEVRTYLSADEMIEGNRALPAGKC